jgi:hypothetical protein
VKGFSFSIRMVVVFAISIVVILLLGVLFNETLATPKTLAEEMIKLDFGSVGG